MQSATQRDQFIEVVWDKINPKFNANFDKYGTDMMTNFNVEYDYGSVLHYSDTAFSIDGSKTIIPKKPTTESIGQRKHLTAKDIEKLNIMYCNQSEPNENQETL